MTAPLVSVLMTLYNRERFVSQAIESVLASSFEDFELIIVDDGSTDRSLEIARGFEGDRRVRVQRNEKNLGDYANRNRAASHATGKYLKYIDSDDLIYTHGLQVMVQCMEEHPDAAVGICKGETRKEPYPIRLTPREAYKQHFSGNGLLSNAPTSTIFRRDAFQEIGGFREDLYFGDCELLLKLAAEFPILLLPAGLAWWRQHGSQGNANHRDVRAFGSLAFRVEREKLTSPNCPLSPEERAQAMRWLKGIQTRRLARKSIRQPAAALDHWNKSGLKPADIRYLFSR